MFAKLFRQYENMTSEARLELMRRDGALVLPALTELLGDGVRKFLVFVFLACGDDGRISPEEYDMLVDAIDFLPEYAAACDIVASDLEKSDGADGVMQLFTPLDDEAKSALVSFCLCFCAARGKGFKQEKRFLKGLVK